MIRSGYKKNFRHSFTFGFILSLVSSLGYWEHRISTNSCLALISITWSTSSAKLKPFQWQILYVLTSPLVTEPRKELNRLQEWTNSKSWRSWNRSVKLTSSVQKWNSNRYWPNAWWSYSLFGHTISLNSSIFSNVGLMKDF